VVAEIDGALHLVPARWWEDQLRQNDLVIADSLVLRFPSVILRAEPSLVVGQLARVLLI
jgi:very-short-patch-repair endonuclease